METFCIIHKLMFVLQLARKYKKSKLTLLLKSLTYLSFSCNPLSVAMGTISLKIMSISLYSFLQPKFIMFIINKISLLIQRESNYFLLWLFVFVVLQVLSRDLLIHKHCTDTHQLIDASSIPFRITNRTHNDIGMSCACILDFFLLVAYKKDIF